MSRRRVKGFVDVVADLPADPQAEPVQVGKCVLHEGALSAGRVFDNGPQIMANRTELASSDRSGRHAISSIV